MVLSSCSKGECMKKILFLLILISISFSVYAENFFAKSRFIELKVGTGVNLSNNLLAANDFMKKELVIDLRQLADDCPDEGFIVLANANPSVAMNLNIKSIGVGFATGIEFFERFDMNKSLFEFLGYGNNIGQAVVSEIKNNAELFAYAQLDVGVNFKKLKLHVKPAVFIPVLAINDSGGTVTAVNDADGTVKIHADLNMDVHTPLDFEIQDGKIKINTASLENNLFTGYGFDVAADLDLMFTDKFGIGATARVPLVPGRLNKKYRVTSSFAFESQVLELGQNDFIFNDPVVSAGIEEELYIHRALKMFAYADAKLFGKFIELYAGAGFGLRRPFSETAIFYPEYKFAVTFNVINIFKLGVFTQYMDQVFAHGLGMTVNARIVQLDLGTSIQSASFKKSFVGAGAGAYAYVTVGF